MAKVFISLSLLIFRSISAFVATSFQDTRNTLRYNHISKVSSFLLVASVTVHVPPNISFHREFTKSKCNVVLFDFFTLFYTINQGFLYVYFVFTQTIVRIKLTFKKKTAKLENKTLNVNLHRKYHFFHFWYFILVLNKNLPI